ncbi:MAG: hypothetical protein KDD51_15085 [Bdellovibrionales bacterium]|nr:hypothetical protein [Bdellovibrionales bacterium]
MHFVLLSFGVLLFWLPLGSHNLLESAYLAERLRISIDNFGIRVGQSDRALLNEVRKMRDVLDRTERAHHALHTCAQAKVPKCIAADLALEKAIEAKILAFRSRVAWKWAVAPVEARRVLLGESVCELIRSPSAPVTWERCRVCGLATKVRVESSTVDTKVSVCSQQGAKVSMKIEIQQEDDAWQYAFRLEE